MLSSVEGPANQRLAESAAALRSSKGFRIAMTKAELLGEKLSRNE